MREILEETGLSGDDLETLPGHGKIAWLGDLKIPYDCKSRNGICCLHMYAGIINAGSLAAVRPETDAGEKIIFEPVGNILASTLYNTRYAGDGDLQYFVNQALGRLHILLSGQEAAP